MTEIIECPFCDVAEKVELVKSRETVKIKDKDITYDNFSYVCLICGIDFDTPETLDSNLERARKEYLLSGEDND